jgi:hypothetical protein
LRLSISASFRTYAKSPVVCERLCKHAFWLCPTTTIPRSLRHDSDSGNW